MRTKLKRELQRSSKLIVSEAENGDSVALKICGAMAILRYNDNEGTETFLELLWEEFKSVEHKDKMAAFRYARSIDKYIEKRQRENMKALGAANV
jgi:hypothetical protein